MPKAEERRHFVRLPFSREATLEGPDGTFTARLEDIGINGARLMFADDSQPEARGTYRLRVSLGYGAEIDMEVSLVHWQGVRAGFRCESVDSQSLANLKRALMLYYGSQEALNAELDRIPFPIRLNRSAPE